MVLPSAPDGVVVVDVSGTVSAANDAAASMFGAPVAELTARLDEMLPAGTLARAMADEDVDSVELDLCLGDGTTVPVQISVSPLGPEQCVIVVRDLTEDRRLHAALMESERRLRDNEALAHVGGWFVDTRNGSVQWSDEVCRIHGVEPGEFGGTYDAAHSFVHPADWREARPLRITALAEEGPIEKNYRIIRPDGQVRWLHVRSEPAIDGSGTVVGLRGVAQDITAQHDASEAARAAYDRERAAAERLRVADRVKDEFLATVSHELRTPLTTILGFAPMLHDALSSDIVAEVGERIERNARDMLAMVERMLDFSRLADGAVEVTCETVADVDELVVSVLEDGGGGDPRIKFSGGCAGVAASTDRQAVRHILGNLVANARRFSPPEGLIEVTTAPDGDAVVVTVADSGPGIAPDLAEKVFERFYRGPGQPPGTRGAGVGLAIARRYAELQGGRIWCSPEEGRGAVFSFTVPLARSRRRRGGASPARSVRNP